MVDIVGRIAARAQLSRWLAGALGGQPVVVVMEGPPGVGKSTLVDWLVGRATAEDAASRVVVVPEQGDVAEDLRHAIAETDELMRRGAPQLLVVDDAQWLDDAGQQMIEHVAFRLGTAAVTGQAARICLAVVARADSPSRLIDHLRDEPITRRMTVAALDDREARELAARVSPGLTDRRTIARLAELSGGNPMTITALADSIALGESLPPPASTTGTIPVEQAWRARLATLSPAAVRAAVVIALGEQSVERLGAGDADLLEGDDAALAELEQMGAVRRRRGGVAFTHPLLRTTALALAPPDVVVEVAGTVLDRLERHGDGGGSTASPGTLVRLSDAARRTGTERHGELLRLAYDEAIERRSWSAAGDLAEHLVGRASDPVERAHWMHRLGTARFNELDRDEATDRLTDAADMLDACAASASADEARQLRDSRAECLLLALRTDFTRSGRRRHGEFDQRVGELIADESLDRRWRARAAAILAELSYASPDHDRRAEMVDAAHGLLAGVTEPLTHNMVHFATGLHRLAILDVDGARQSFTLSHEACDAVADAWWASGDLARRGLVALVADEPMPAMADANVGAEMALAASNWAEHGMALAVRSVAATRLGRFTDGDNDTESAILSARRAESSDPLLASLSTALWRRAVRGDEPGVRALRELARQHQLYIPFAELVAEAMLRGIDDALEEVRPRWTSPRNGLSFRNLGFHLAQLEAAVLTGNLEVVDDLHVQFRDVYRRGVLASNDWPTSLALVMAAATIELGDDGADEWLGCSQQAAAASGSIVEQALGDAYRSRHMFATGRGGQLDLDRGRAALDALDAMGAPLLARLQRERLTAVIGQLGMPAGRVRTVMFTDIVDSTQLMSSAGNAAWAVILGEHHRIVRTVVGHHRGSIMTSTGDGFSSWFEHPSEAVTAARHLHQAIDHAALVVPGGAVKVRVGLASGSVFDLGADASGMAVAEAARVMAAAGPGQTYVSQSVLEHGVDVVIGRSVGVHVLKGLPDPVEIFELAPVDPL